MDDTAHWALPRKLDADRFQAFAADCRAAAAKLKDALGGAALADDDVCIMGRPGRDVFIIERISLPGGSEEGMFEFCRTRRLSHGDAVERCLRLLQEHFPGANLADPD